MSDIAILFASLHNIARLGLPFVFTDRHARLITAQFFSDLETLLSWTGMDCNLEILNALMMIQKGSNATRLKH